MIKEAYCSFEVARLLEEKGFNEVVHAYHNIYDKVNLDFNVSVDAPHLQIPCPTHQMAMAWLREVHNIDIIIFHEKLPNDCYWARIERHPFTEFQQEPEYKTYEEAVEAALKYCLDNLI